MSRTARQVRLHRRPVGRPDAETWDFGDALDMLFDGADTGELVLTV